MSDPRSLTAIGDDPAGEAGAPVPVSPGTGPHLGRRVDSGPFLRDIAGQLGRLRLGRFSGVYLWALFVLVFALWIPSSFLTVTTAQTIASQEAIFLILALGVTVSMSAGQFDLSIGNNMGLGAAVCILLLTNGHFAAGPAVALAVLVCVLTGVGNAVLVVVVGIDSFIATLGMSSVVLALTEWATNNQYVGPTKQSFSDFVTWQPLGIPILAVYAVVAALLVWYGLEHTPMGRRIYATGANPDTARLSGIPIRRYIAGSLIFTGLIAGLAGVLLASDLSTVEYSVGQGYLLPTFAACFLSTTQVKPGRFNVWGVVVSLILLATGEKGLILAGAPTWITDMFDGVALLAAVGLAVVFRKRAAARAVKPLSEFETAHPAAGANAGQSG